MHITRLPPSGTRPYVRALSESEGFHWTEIRSANDGAEQLVLQASHDVVSDEFHKRADDELAIILDLRDYRLIHNHIRAAMNYRAEAYRHEDLEDERRDAALAAIGEARDAGVAGSGVCEEALTGWSRGKREVCSHGRAS